jgi:endonuclease YncB( thermonuclease family)
MTNLSPAVLPPGRLTLLECGIIISTILWLAAPCWAIDFVGKVIGVTDGDTLTVLREGRPERIRLVGIDAPEHGQPFGTRAKQAASALAFGEEVTVRTIGHDRYGRTLGEVVLPDGRLLNHELVRQGFAWWYRHYSSDQRLATLEAEARTARRGLWADPEPIPPWEWRRAQHPVRGSK